MVRFHSCLGVNETKSVVFHPDKVFLEINHRFLIGCGSPLRSFLVVSSIPVNRKPDSTSLPHEPFWARDRSLPVYEKDLILTVTGPLNRVDTGV